ncbi:MAG TPA: LysR family transcriptional regulator [Casimicrobiaceae bacterium]|nr:LysR family transcriptional regulator [Casimicrobiaceae bacterium]
MGRVDLNLLPIAIALYDESSVSRAALALGMSQPAVSMALRKLRASFHDPLFVRARSGVTPTPRAHALVRAARPLVTELQLRLLAEEQFDPGVSERPFTFALSDVGEMVFLPRLLERLRAKAPNAAIRSVSMPPDQIAEGLESGGIDLAIGYFPDLAQASFFQQRLFTHAFGCLLRADHPRRSRRLSLDAFLAMEHAVVRTEGRSQELFERFLARKRIQRRIVLLTPHFLSLPMIIARSDLVTTVPHALGIYFSRLSPELCLVRPPFDIEGFDLRQHWHHKYHSDSRNQWLRREVALLFNDENDEYRVGWRLPPRSRSTTSGARRSTARRSRRP